MRKSSPFPSPRLQTQPTPPAAARPAPTAQLTPTLEYSAPPPHPLSNIIADHGPLQRSLPVCHCQRFRRSLFDGRKEPRQSSATLDLGLTTSRPSVELCGMVLKDSETLLRYIPFLPSFPPSASGSSYGGSPHSSVSSACISPPR